VSLDQDREEDPEDPPVVRTPKIYERSRYCSECKADVAAVLQIQEYAGRDIHVYILKCPHKKVLSDRPVPAHASRPRLARFETFTAGGLLWRLYKAEWVLIPMNLMAGQWYYEPESYAHNTPFSDSCRSEEHARQAILDALAGKPTLPVPAGGHSNAKSRILARLTQTAQTALARISSVGAAAWSTDNIPFWGNDLGGEDADMDEDVAIALRHLRGPHLRHRAGALYWLLGQEKAGKLKPHAEEWQASLHRAFKMPSTDHGSLFASLARFSAFYAGSIKADPSTVWPLTCELYASTVDPTMSKLVGTRFIRRYEAAVRNLCGDVPAEVLDILPQGQEYLNVRAIYLFVVFEAATETDLPDSVQKYLVRCACSPAVTAVPKSLDRQRFSAPLEAAHLLTYLGVMWLVKASDVVRSEYAELATLPGGEFLKDAFLREKVLLPAALLARAGVAA
jgi:hypothetical protein